MSREHKFRGKRVDNNDWVYGSLIIDEVTDKYYIVLSVEESEKIGEEGCLKVISCEIIPETVGEYTELKESRNLIGEHYKKEIYEGDVIKEDGWDDLYLIKFEDCKYIAKKLGKGNGDIFTRRNKDLDDVLWAVVIGNKTDNPELLEN